MQHDVIIVGGGLVGATLAVALSAHGLSAALVDRADLTATRTTAFDGRVSAITSASARMFDAIGLGGVIARHGCAMNEIRVTDGLSALHLHFDSAEAGTGPLGYMVENRHLRAALLDAVTAAPAIRLHAPAGIAAVERGTARTTVALEDGAELSAPLIVAADGRRSPLRDEGGIRLAQWRYGAVSLVTTIGHAVPHGNIAFELFFTTGPLAVLPMLSEGRRQRSAIVWTVPERDAPGWADLHPAALARELEARMEGFLGPLELLTPVTRYPLELARAERLVDHRLALVGDAGHVIHPIAGQGLNLGLRDVAALTQVLVEGTRLGLDLGDAQLLTRYQRWRRLDTSAVTAATDLLARLFGLPGRPVAAVRRLGLAAVNRVRPLKARFMAEARGEAGELPRLLTGQLA